MKKKYAIRENKIENAFKIKLFFGNKLDALTKIKIAS